MQPGDCIVAFSRKDIFEIKAEIERTTDHKVGTVAVLPCIFSKAIIGKSPRVCTF